MQPLSFVQLAQSILKAIWRYRVLFLSTLIGMSIGLLTIISCIPNIYLAQSKVYIDTKSLLKPLLKGMTVDTDPYSRLVEMTKIVFSRVNIEKIAANSELALTNGGLYKRERLYQKLEKTIRLKRSGETDLYTIEVRHEDPDTAKRLVQSVLNLFVELSLQTTQGDRNHVENFLDEQIQDYESRLQASEKRLADFKRQHMEELPRDNQGYYDKLQSALEQLDQAILEREALKNQKLALTNQWHTEQKSDDSTTIVSNMILIKLAELTKMLSEKEIRYTKDHPDIQQLQLQINTLKQQLDTPPYHSLLNLREESLSFQQWQIALSELTSQIAAAESKVFTWQNRVAHLREKVDNMIQVETALSGLNRDYAILKKQHQSLLERRESANLSKQTAVKNESWQFQLIDPPYVLGIPVWPNRFLLNIVGLLLSLSGSVTVCYLRQQLIPKDFILTGLPGRILQWCERPFVIYVGLCIYAVLFLLVLVKTSYYV